jgi:hypothetical protein
MIERKYRQRLEGGAMGSVAARFLVIACAVALGACTEEDPMVIDEPVPRPNVTTFEIILQPAQFLVFDTAFSGYLNAYQSGIAQVMRDFEGVTDANGLYRFGVLQRTLTVRDTSGTSREDTLPRFPDGYLLLRIDSTASRGAATFGAYQTTQEWHPPSASWTMRVDTGNVHLSWTTPGGTRGALIGTAQWRPGTGVDSLMIPLDSTRIKALTDTANHARGVLLTLDQATGAGGASVRVRAVEMRVNGKSSIRPDTTIVVSVTADREPTFVYNPAPPTGAAGTLRVSGVPAWRGMLGLLPNLGELSVPCGAGGCTVRLRDAHVNLAELLLQPTPSQPGFSPEDSVLVGAQALLEIPGVPLARSPLGTGVGTTRTPIAAQRFATADVGPAVGLPITGYFGSLVADTASVSGSSQVPRRLALMRCERAVTGSVSCGPTQAGTFGFANFQAGPRLRLVLTISPDQR